MPAECTIPIYMRIGNGTETEIGQVVLEVEQNGTVTLTTSDIAAGLRSAADAIEGPEEVDSAAADD
jgi:hypothetical protein